MAITKLKIESNTVAFTNKPKSGFISVIVPVYMDLPGLKDTLDSLMTQSLHKTKFEVIVVNDGAAPEVSKLCRLYQNCVEVKITPNKGSYRGRNSALEISKGEYLAFTDADVKVPPTWLETGISLLAKYDYVGGPVNFPAIKNPSFTEKYEKDHAFHIQEYFEKNHYCVTANLFVSRFVFEKVGGFDRRLQSGGDYEFGARVHLAGMIKQGYSKEIPVLHPHRTFSQLLDKNKRVTLGAHNLKKYFPERFKSMNLYIVDEILYALRPTEIPKKPFMYFLFLWFMRVVLVYHRFRYFKNFVLLRPKNS